MMNRLYDTSTAVPGTTGGSALGAFQAAFTLTALPLLGYVPRVQSRRTPRISHRLPLAQAATVMQAVIDRR
jgi:hypothetical protein